MHGGEMMRGYAIGWLGVALPFVAAVVLPAHSASCRYPSPDHDTARRAARCRGTP